MLASMCQILASRRILRGQPTILRFADGRELQHADVAVMVVALKSHELGAGDDAPQIGGGKVVANEGPRSLVDLESDVGTEQAQTCHRAARHVHAREVANQLNFILRFGWRREGRNNIVSRDGRNIRRERKGRYVREIKVFTVRVNSIIDEQSCVSVIHI